MVVHSDGCLGGHALGAGDGREQPFVVEAGLAPAFRWWSTQG